MVAGDLLSAMARKDALDHGRREPGPSGLCSTPH
jgi:hypothetical protein